MGGWREGECVSRGLRRRRVLWLLTGNRERGSEV